MVTEFLAEAAAATHWFTEDLGHRSIETQTGAEIEVDLVPELCLEGTSTPRVATLATLADIVAGMAIQRRVTPRVPLTVDLDVRQSLHRRVSTIRGVARPLRIGGALSVIEVRFYAGDDIEGPFALSHSRFILSPNPTHRFDPEMHSFTSKRRLSAPLVEALGLELLAPGVVRLAKHPYVLQPAGTIQGGAIALVAELAIETALSNPVVEIDVHYLAATKVGPIESTIDILGHDLARATVVDRGNADRLVAVATGRVLASLGDH